MSTPEEVAAELRLLGVTAQGRVSKVVTYHGNLLKSAAMRHASGRPGPNAITGDLRRSIALEVTSTSEKIVATTGTDKVQGPRLEFGFEGTDSLGRVYCVDEATEILTEFGWQSCHDLRPGTAVWTLNPDRWLSEWQLVSDVSIFPGPHDVLAVEARSLNAVSTADHRWLTERYYSRKSTWVREWRTTATMPPNARVPLAAKPSGETCGPPVDDDVVELVAWFWTEGSFDFSRVMSDRPKSIKVSQSGRVNPTNCARIEAMLNRLLGSPGPFRDGAHWHRRTAPATDVNVYTIDRVGCWLIEDAVTRPSKALQPAWLRRLRPDQLETLISLSMDADGHRDASGTSRLGQANEDRIRSWEMACALAGIAVRTTDVTEGRWTTTLLRSTFSHGFGSALRKDRDHVSVERLTIPGPVWCPTTPNGTWLARREGAVYFTGNSQPPYPFLGPALDEIAPAFEQAIAEAGLA